MNTATVQPDLMLKVDDNSILPSLRKVLKAIPGVTLISTRRKKGFTPSPEQLTRMEIGREEIRQGKCTVCRTHQDIDSLLASL